MGNEAQDSSAADAPPAIDGYERKYMRGSGAVVHREKTIWKLHWLLLFAPFATLLMSVLGFLGLGSKPMPIAMAVAMLPLTAVLLGLWALFIALRVTVTSREVMVQYGPYGPKIPLEGIESVVVRDYPALALGGGVKRLDGAWAYTLWGQGTRVVRIEWHDARGKKHATIVSSPDPDKLAAAIQQARGAAGAPTRVDASAGVSEAALAEVEREVAAVSTRGQQG